MNQKKEYIKKIILYVFFVVLWVAPDFANHVKLPYYIDLVLFIVSVVALKCIKNKGLVLLINLAATTIAILVDYKYVFFALPSLLLINVHSETIKVIKDCTQKKKNEYGNLYITAAVMIIFAQIVYSIVVYSDKENHYLLDSIREGKVLIGFILFFVILICFIDKTKIKSKEVRYMFLMLYGVALAGIVVNCFYYYSVSATYIHLINEYFIYWYLLLLFICFNDDPNLDCAGLKLNKFLTK